MFCTSTTDLFPFGPVGVSDALEADGNISVFPNPSASGAFTLRVEGRRAAGRYQIFDAVGRCVATGTIAHPDTVLDLRAQAAGVYALRLTTPTGRPVTRRLVRW